MKILQHKEIKKISQPVTDIESQVLPLIPIMQAACQSKIGRIGNIVALAHCQVEKENPLTFFVMRDGLTVVNPEIISKEEPFTHKEGCASYAFRSEKKVKRYGKIHVKYTIVKGEKIEEIEEDVFGFTAAVFQHEIDHFKNKYIYVRH